MGGLQLTFSDPHPDVDTSVLFAPQTFSGTASPASHPLQPALTCGLKLLGTQKLGLFGA